MDSRNELQRKKREERKKRRFRNQMISYMVTAILILAMAAGIVFGADRLLGGKEETGRTARMHLRNRPGKACRTGSRKSRT